MDWGGGARIGCGADFQRPTRLPSEHSTRICDDVILLVGTVECGAADYISLLIKIPSADSPKSKGLDPVAEVHCISWYIKINCVRVSVLFLIFLFSFFCLNIFFLFCFALNIFSFLLFWFCASSEIIIKKLSTKRKKEKEKITFAS